MSECSKYNVYLVCLGLLLILSESETLLTQLILVVALGLATSSANKVCALVYHNYARNYVDAYSYKCILTLFFVYADLIT